MFTARKPAILALIFFLLITADFSWGAPPPAGKLILVQGEVTVRRSGSSQWEEARFNQELYTGDAIRTGPASRAAIICADESQIKLNEKTLLILKNVAPSPRLFPAPISPAAPQTSPASIYEVPEGEIWLRNKREKFRFELETPAAQATIRGTEFNIQVGPAGATRIILLEGHLCVSNVYGEICLRPGEQGFVIPGRAPTKQVLVQPADAVQWSLYYPGIFSFRDLPLTPGPGEVRAPAGPARLAALIHQAETDYDQGRLEEARSGAEAVLRQAPGNPRALTLLGWINLQKNNPEEASTYFTRVRAADGMAIIGQALSRYRLGDLVGAYRTMEQAHRLPPSPKVVSMTAYFAILAGRVEQAKPALEAVIREAPDVALPRAFLTQVYLVQNRKDAARSGAAALARFPDSPLALLTLGLVRMSYFELPAATQLLEKAIALDPCFVDAYVYLARIWLGSEYLARARQTIEKALRLAPRDGAVLSLAGFVRLAYRDYEGALKYWEAALKANPLLGEPHLGLAIYYFRHRRFDQGLAQMLEATLLEPRVSLFQSELGKALYQTRAFERALEVFDYAKTLDPHDPTPHLYKGIALSDLNRPGEAIQEINRSIALNDNTAIFRTRLALDRDLAVRNYNLARAYDQLGLREWAFSKAVTAVKKDPYNSSAHLFLEKSHANTPQGVFASFTEDVFFRLLAPANQNTFMNIRNDNYTPMFEMPYGRVLAQTGIGTWQNKNSIQDHSLVAYGGLPGLGFWLEGDYFDDRGMRNTNNDLRTVSPLAFLKWDPTVNGSLMGLFQYRDTEFGDIFFPNDAGYAPQPFFRSAQRFWAYELGYVHRFNPKATLLTYFNYQKWQNRSVFSQLNLPFAPFTFDFTSSTRDDWNFGNLQAQQNLVLGKHNLIAGVDYFNGRRHFKQQNTFTFAFLGVPFFTSFSGQGAHPPEWTYSFYLLDFWRLHPKVLLELGIIKDFAKNSVSGFSEPIYTSLWSPLVGVNLFVTPQHTLRFAAQRHLVTHTAWGAASLLPTETAGFTWLINTFNATELRSAGASWEAEWDKKTFSVLRFEALRLAVPTYTTDGFRQWLGYKRYDISIILNRILHTSLGLSAGVLGRRVIPDPNPEFTAPALGPPFQDYSEFRSFLGLSFLHRTGWQAGIKTTLVKQHLKDRADTFFGLVDLRFGKEFAHKRGLATLEITNLFNRSFFVAQEPFRFTDADFFPARRILFKFALYF